MAGDDKVEKPHAHFDTPHAVVADPGLSRHEKAEALQHLEQDALQLSVAAGEGMTGGEPSNLDEVLDAKEALNLPPADLAYAAVLRDLRQRRAAGTRQDAQALIDNAIAAIEAVQRAVAGSPGADPTPGTAAEIAKEAALEKLDP